MATRDYTHGSILRSIMAFALPYMLAYFLQMVYGLADLFVIGLYCGVSDTTAVSIGAQVMHMVTVVIIGLAMGTTVLTAQGVGSRDERRTMTVIGNSISLFALLAAVLTIGLLATRDDIILLMDTPAEAIAATAQYMTVCFAGIPFIVAYNVIAAMFRGLGDTQRPLYFVGVAFVANVALDFILIGGLHMGAMGAALGTTLSQMVSVVAALWYVRTHHSLISVGTEQMRPHRDTMRHILGIGAPVALQDGCIQVAFLAITVIANGRGLTDAAAVGIVEKFIGLVFIIPSAMLATVSTLAAQCVGAGMMPRARRTMRIAMAIATSYGIVMALALQVVPELAVGLFTSDSAVLAQGADYLRGYVWDCIFAGVHFCFSGFFTACGYSLISFAHNLLSIVCARVPLAYLASIYYPDRLFPMGISTCAGSILSCIVCIVAYRWLTRLTRGTSPT